MWILSSDLESFCGPADGNMTDWSNKPVPCSGKKLRKGHNNVVAVPLKKPDDNGYPKCPCCAPADVPAGAPLLKVYDYGPLGARFFLFQARAVAPHPVDTQRVWGCNLEGMRHPIGA